MNLNEIPQIPNLNFEKKSKGYLFNSDEGKLISDGFEYDISNIKITVSDDIDITFNITNKNIFQVFDDNKIFEITCSSNEYLIKLNNCHCYHESEIIKANAYKITLIKNNNFINDDENINVWNITESNIISECNCYQFDEEDLEDILLYEVKIDTVERPFNQLLDNYYMIYYKTKYENRFNNAIMDNIILLSYIYSSNINPPRMRVFENITRDKLEIEIYSKNTTKLEGLSIFRIFPCNFYNFLKSSYSNLKRLNDEGNIDINLLIHYYVWIKNESYLEVKLVLASIFLEVLNKDKRITYTGNDFKPKFEEELIFLGLDCLKLFKYLKKDIYDIFEKIKEECCSEDDTTEFFIDLKKEFFLFYIKQTRNMIIHEGLVTYNRASIDYIVSSNVELFKKFEGNYNTNATDDNRKFFKKCFSKIKDELKQVSLMEILNQEQFFEKLIEIILLRCLNTDCIMETTENSKEFIKQFKID